MIFPKYRISDTGADFYKYLVEKRSWDSLFPIWVRVDTYKTIEEARNRVEFMKDWNRREKQRRNPVVLEHH